MHVTWPYDVENYNAWPPLDVEAFRGAMKSPLRQLDERVTRAVSNLYCEVPGPSSGAVLPIVPRFVDQRMLAQESRFTLHPPAGPALSEPYLLSIRIPKEAKPFIQLELRRVSVRWDTLFPDLEHVARDLSMGWLSFFPGDSERPRFHGLLPSDKDVLMTFPDQYNRSKRVERAIAELFPEGKGNGPFLIERLDPDEPPPATGEASITGV